MNFNKVLLKNLALISDDWLEEEAAKREEPQVKKLTRIAETILQENQGNCLNLCV